MTLLPYLLIPLGGSGERFRLSGYITPKPLICGMGKPILFWLLDSLDLCNIHSIIIPYNRDLAKYRFEDELRKNYPKIKFKFLIISNTKGAADTIRIGLNDISKKEVDRPLICLDGDNFYKIPNLLKSVGGKNTIVCFSYKDTSDYATPFSHVELEQGSNICVQIVEKERISEWALTGCYCFSSWKKALRSVDELLESGVTQRGEYYMSGLVMSMIRDGEIFEAFQIEHKDYVCLGTPADLRIFCHNVPLVDATTKNRVIQPLRICFDLDNTLVTYPSTPDDYTTVQPIESNISYLKMLRKMGHIIVIHTARRMKTFGGNLGQVMVDIGLLTFNQLNKFNIEYDEIYFGKPNCDFYIDDKAVSAFEDLEKATGFYRSGNVAPRSFNAIVPSNSLAIFEKRTSNYRGLEGEIHYYSNIPPSIRDMFPIMVEYDDDFQWYKVERINGVPICTLYLAEEMTMGLLNSVMSSIKRLQSTTAPSRDFEVAQRLIHENYTSKIKKRYEEYDYSGVSKDADKIYQQIIDRLALYENSGKARVSVIHGDPVLTNILLNNMGKIKFIDMRGLLSNETTICGDWLYDWAKLYQSLVGYEEIREGMFLSRAYKTSMLTHFEDFFIREFGNNSWDDMIVVVQSLLFSLIPLHDNEKCKSYFDLISSITA